ncbi:MAG: hypothetical protein ACOYEW_00950 [Anaerolineae bacterium]|jgi:hypothetical protein
MGALPSLLAPSTETRPAPCGDGLAPVRQAILEALTYGDLFDYALSPEQILRYLTVAADPVTVRDLLDGGTDGIAQRTGGLFTLPGRGALVAVRARRQAIAQGKWADADPHLRRIAALPFVRMIAVTGSLALDNAEEDGDVDLFIVTAAGRLWLCRAFVVLAVRRATMSGLDICPNYFLSEARLALPSQSLFDARELAQMVPVYGMALYRQVRALNPWVEGFLPQAGGPPEGGRPEITLSARQLAAKQALERLLGGRLGQRLEDWEMGRKVRRFQRRAQGQAGHVCFTADCCKGHFGDHHAAIAQQFERRLAQYGLTMESSLER